jgi:hypothetical protein
LCCEIPDVLDASLELAPDLIGGGGMTAAELSRQSNDVLTAIAGVLCQPTSSTMCPPPALDPLDGGGAIRAGPTRVWLTKSAIAGYDFEAALLEGLHAAILGDRAVSDRLHGAPWAVPVIGIAVADVAEHDRCGGGAHTGPP